MTRDPIEIAPSKRGDVDFNWVDPKHADIHDRLINWARWCIGGGGGGMQPMFHGFRSSETFNYARETIVPVNPIDAQRLEKGVRHLPDLHAAAVRWSYVYRNSPSRMARSIGCTLARLQELVRDGRCMLINRGV